MTHLDISAVLNSALDSYCAEHGYDIVWEDTEYTPTTKVYMEPYYLPGKGERFLASTVVESIPGIYQININVPASNARGFALNIIDELIALYGKSVYLPGKGRVSIVKASIGAKQNNGQWVTEILDIKWMI